MAVMQDSKTVWLKDQGQNDTSLASYFDEFSKIYQLFGASETVSQLTEQSHKISDEIRFFNQGINFFENVIYKTENEMPEISQFKSSLEKAKKKQKAIELTINCLSV